MIKKTPTELGEKRAFKFSALSAWDKLQISPKLWEPVSLETFKVILNDWKESTSGYRCFLMLINVLMFYDSVAFCLHFVMCLFYVYECCC